MPGSLVGGFPIDDRKWAVHASVVRHVMHVGHEGLCTVAQCSATSISIQKHVKN